MKIPDGYQAVMPYLIVKDAAKFIDFMKAVFGAAERLRIPRTVDAIMHAEIAVAGCVMMLADATEEYKPRPGGFFIYVKDADETYKVALAHGATSIAPPADQEYGRSCGVVDAFGNSWWPTTAK